MLKNSEIKSQFPKAHQKLVSFIIERLQQAQKMVVPEGTDVDLPEIPASFAERAMDGMLLGNHRTLFDFFDNQQIFIEIQVIDDENVISFSYMNKFFGGGCILYKSRIEAELEAFKSAFKLLEEQS